MAGVVVTDGHPIERRAEIGFHPGSAYVLAHLECGRMRLINL